MSDCDGELYFYQSSIVLTLVLFFKIGAISLDLISLGIVIIVRGSYFLSDYGIHYAMLSIAQRTTPVGPLLPFIFSSKVSYSYSGLPYHMILCKLTHRLGLITFAWISITNIISVIVYFK